MRILIVTQKIHEDDDDLAFVILWVKEFIRQGFDVEVICLEKGRFDDSFPVHSLGKEKGCGRFSRALRFLKLIMTLRYDRVFVHMNPEYITLGGWWWFVRGVPVYLWYTHYSMTVHVFLAGLLCKRMFAATPQSLPQYTGSPKKVVVGHGIDVDFWIGDKGHAHTSRRPTHDLLMVHRISRSKRAEIGIKALTYLPADHSLTIYGREIDKMYAAELRELIKVCNLTNRVHFAGPVPMRMLKEVYPQYRIMVNMASETIDKTMVEGMLFGVYPVTTKANSRAIGLPVYPEDDRADTVADFIKDRAWAAYDTAYLSEIVRKRHSLPSLIERMGEYIMSGT